MACATCSCASLSGKVDEIVQDGCAGAAPSTRSNPQRMGQYPIPVVILARLAIALSHQGRGVGIGLLQNAIRSMPLLRKDPRRWEKEAP